MEKDNEIFIGPKPFMNYVTGIVMQFTTKGASEVFVKARGKFISRAVDVAQVAALKFLDDTISISDVGITSDEFKNREGKMVRVSSIEIKLEKK